MQRDVLLTPEGLDKLKDEIEHLGALRAGRYLRKFYPWYVERLAAAADAPGLDVHGVKQLQRALQATSGVGEARAVLNEVSTLPVAA